MDDAAKGLRLFSRGLNLMGLALVTFVLLLPATAAGPLVGFSLIVGLVGIVLVACATLGAAGWRMRTAGVPTGGGWAMVAAGGMLVPVRFGVEWLAVFSLGSCHSCSYAFPSLALSFAVAMGTGLLLAGGAMGVAAAARRAFAVTAPPSGGVAFFVALAAGVPVLGEVVLALYLWQAARRLAGVARRGARPPLGVPVSWHPTERAFPRAFAVLAVLLLLIASATFAAWIGGNGVTAGQTKPTATLAAEPSAAGVYTVNIIAVSMSSIEVSSLTFQVVSDAGVRFFDGDSGTTTQFNGTNTTVSYSGRGASVAVGDVILVRAAPPASAALLQGCSLRVITGSDVLGAVRLP